MWAHYLARTLGLVALAIGVNLFFSHHNGLRADITSENLNSLSPRTVQLVKELRDDDKVKPIKIDAYVSPQVPAEYAAAQAESALDALRAELAQRRKDPGRRPRGREFQRRGLDRRKGVRHRAARSA